MEALRKASDGLNVRSRRHGMGNWGRWKRGKQRPMPISIGRNWKANGKTEKAMLFRRFEFNSIVYSWQFEEKFVLIFEEKMPELLFRPRLAALYLQRRDRIRQLPSARRRIRNSHQLSAKVINFDWWREWIILFRYVFLARSTKADNLVLVNDSRTDALEKSVGMLNLDKKDIVSVRI